MEQLIVAAQGAYLAREFAAFAQVGRVPCAGTGVEDNPRSLAHDLHGQQDVIEDGARGQWRRVEQSPAGTVDGAGGADDRTGGGLQFANLLFHAPVQPHSLPGLSARGITQHQFAARGADIGVGEILDQQTQSTGFDLLAGVGKQQHVAGCQRYCVVETSGFALRCRFHQRSHPDESACSHLGIPGVVGKNGRRAVA